MNAKKVKEADIFVSEDFAASDAENFFLSSVLQNYNFSRKEDVWGPDIKDEEKAEKSSKPVLLDSLNLNA